MNNGSWLPKLAGVALLLFVLYGLWHGGDLAQFLADYHQSGLWPALRPLRRFLIPFALILLLERLLPAEPAPASARWLLFDFLWGLVTAAAFALLFGTVVGTIARAVAPWSLHLQDNKPVWLQFLLGLVTMDLIGYGTHRLFHHLRWGWALHSVHHSQIRLNMFTDNRFHALEVILSQLAITLPLALLGLSDPVSFYIGWILVWFLRFQHANIRTSLGPLRYILVTPQSHRIHHSLEPRHRDRNFGIYLSVWDFLFGTQYKGWHDYPATGIEEPRFPLETSSWQAFSNLALQLAYPFRKAPRPTPLT